MSRITPFAFGLALPFALISQAAMADLTPAQVWSDWRQYMASVGYKIDATETANGSDLALSGVNLTMAMPEGNGDMTMTFEAIKFKQNNDGTVAIVLPEKMPMTIKGSGGFADGKDMSMTINITQTGHAMTASGSPEKVTYAYGADTIKMDLDQILSDTQNVANDSVKIAFTGNTVSSTTTMTIGDLRGYEQSSSIAGVTYTMLVDSPRDGGQKANVTGTAMGITIGGTGTLPTAAQDMTDLAALIGAGFDVAGNIAYTSGTSNFDVQNAQSGDFKMQSSSQGGALNVAIGAGGLAYSGAQKDLKMALNVVGMPFPIELAMAQSGFNLALPVQKADDAQDFAFGITLGEFTMSDLIWSMFDGAGQLPRDPATIMLDLTGKAKVLVDFLIPQNVANIDGPQASVETVTLNTLLVSAAGAKLQGSGDVAFDPNGPMIIPGMGTPVGAISLALAGGNGLLDKLTAMGLLPQEQAMGARMMMGIFTVPGDAPDTLNSRIEFTQDGQVLANGQRIR